MSLITCNLVKEDILALDFHSLSFLLILVCLSLIFDFVKHKNLICHVNFALIRIELI